MRKGVCVERNLKEYQYCHLNKNGLIIHTVKTGISKKEDERLAYKSHMMIIFIGNWYIGHSDNITIWGPLSLIQLNDMRVIVEIPKMRINNF